VPVRCGHCGANRFVKSVRLSGIEGGDSGGARLVISAGSAGDRCRMPGGRRAQRVTAEESSPVGDE